MLPSIRERNEQFASLTVADKRVAVARDVIAQLDLKQLIAHSGVYADLRGANKEECHVCALGALGVSVLNGSALHCSAYSLREGLAGIFDRDVLVEVEQAFECWDKYEHGGGGTLSDEDRLRQIMQNIIDSGGDFVGSDLPWYCPGCEEEEEDYHDTCDCCGNDEEDDNA